MPLEGKEIYEFGQFRLDVGEHSFSRADGVRNGSLPEKAFQTLTVLVRNQGRLLTKQELLDEVWPDTFVEENNLDKCIHAIRHAVGERPGEHRYIETVRKRGYRFVADVRRLPVSAEPNVPVEQISPAATEHPTEKEFKITLWFPAAVGLGVFGLVILPVLFFDILMIGGFPTFGWPESTTAVDSIAVMPLVNETGNGDFEYISDGMTESLINRLSQVPNLNVKARTVVFRYKNRDVDPQTVGNELSVRAVLSGRMIQRGDQMMLSLELTDARTGDQLWGGQYKRGQFNLVTLPSEVVRDLLDKVQTNLSDTDKSRLAKNYTENADAYLLYLKGRFHWNKRRTTKDFEKAIEYFEQAVAIDSNYALAYAGLSDAELGLSAFDGRPPLESMPKVRDYAEKALALDDKLAEAHAAMGNVLFYGDHDFEGAEREFQRAIELNPKYAAAHHFYGSLLRALGRHDEALAKSVQALEIEPLSLVVNWHHGGNLMFARRYDEAIEQLKKTIDLDAGFALAHHSLGIAYEMRGDYSAGIEAFARYEELIGNPADAEWTRDVFAKAGWKGYAEARPTKLRATNMALRYPAAFYASLGDKEKAIEELNKAYDNREYQIVLIKIDPRLDSLRGDPRFAQLMRRVGLPE